MIEATKESLPPMGYYQAFQKYNPFTPLIRWVQDYPIRQVAKSVEIFCSRLSELEKIPVGSGGLPIEVVDADQFTMKLLDSTHEMMRNARLTLNRYILAQKYRYGVLPDSEREIDDEDCKLLLNQAIEWKEENRIYSNKKLTEEEIEKIREVCCYLDFAKHLLDDKEWREHFFSWILPNDTKEQPFRANDVEVFVKFPGLHKQIMRRLCYVNSRVGGSLFKVDREEQVVTIPIEGSRVKVLLGDEKYELRGRFGDGKLTLTIRQIFEDMEKQLIIGRANVDVFNEKEGFFNYSPAERGAWHEDLGKILRPTLDDPDFFKKTPFIERLTEEEVQQRYNVRTDLDLSLIPGYEGQYAYCPKGRYPFIIIRGTQQGENEIRGTHSYYDLVIPTEEGDYLLYAVGQLVSPFPQTATETFLFLPAWHNSRMNFGDWNRHAGRREHSSWPIEPYPTPGKWGDFMKSLFLDTLYGDRGVLGFHMVVYHCTNRLFDKMRKIFGAHSLPNLKKRFWSLTPSGMEGKIFYAFKQTPIGNTLFKLLYFTFGSWRWMTIKTASGKTKTVSMLMWKTIFIDKPRVVHPGGLFEAKKEKQRYKAAL